MQNIAASDLICMNDLENDGLVRVMLAYAQADNLLFGERIYRSDARLYLHKLLAGPVIQAAKAAKAAGYTLILYDGLRTTSAQKKMLTTRRVRDNPHWLEEPRLLSPPGGGGHPRGMAVDVSLLDAAGSVLDMGTAFDFLAADPSPEHNPAHRAYTKLTPEAAANRAVLDGFMLHDASVIGLSEEWWDFRLKPEIIYAYAPLSDDDLPPEMRLCD